MEGQLIRQQAVSNGNLAWVACVVAVVSILVPLTIAAPFMAPLRDQGRAVPGSPPPLTFAIVWPILYALIGVAIVFLALRPSAQSTPAIQWTAMALLLAQLVLNWAWTPVFATKNKFASTVMILIMLMVTLAVIVLCTRVQILSGALLAPYAGWLVYALILSSRAQSA